MLNGRERKDDTGRKLEGEKQTREKGGRERERERRERGREREREERERERKRERERWHLTR